MLLLIASLLLYTCGDSEAEIIDSVLAGGDGVVPETTLLTPLVITGNGAYDPSYSTATFEWEGNETALAFNYKLVLDGYDGILVDQDYFDWLEDDEWMLVGDCDTRCSVTFEDLDEGSYTFYVKSRLNPALIEPEPEAPQFPFTIDAITGPALRIYPLKQTVNLDTEFEIYLFGEDISCYDENQIDVFAIESELSYDSNLEFIPNDPNDLDEATDYWNFPGSLLKTYLDTWSNQEPFILSPPADNAIVNTLIVSAGIAVGSVCDGSGGEDACAGLSGTGAIMKLKFELKGSGPGTININSALLANPFSADQNDITNIEKRLSGLIEESE